MQNNHHCKTCSLYALLFRKSTHAQEEGGPWVVLPTHQEEDALYLLFLTVQGAEIGTKQLEHKKHQSCLYFHLCCNYFSNEHKITSVTPMGHLSLLSLTASINALYNLVTLTGFKSFSAPHLRLIHLPVLPIPAIWLTSQEWGDGKIGKMLLKIKCLDFTRDFNPGMKLKDNQQGSWRPGTSYIQNLDLLGHSCCYCTSFCQISCYKGAVEINFKAGMKASPQL